MTSRKATSNITDNKVDEIRRACFQLWRC